MNLDVLVQQMSPSQRAELAADLASIPAQFTASGGIGAPAVRSLEPRTRRFIQAVVDQLRELG